MQKNSDDIRRDKPWKHCRCLINHKTFSMAELFTIFAKKRMAEFENDYNDVNDREYTNGEITVFWKPRKCIHATTCYRELIEVFNPRKRPWVNMDGAPSEEIIRVVDLCPTKALAYKWNKDAEHKQGEEQSKSVQNEVRIMKDGPVLIKGDFSITGSDGKPIKTMKMASICRCGMSMNMPFCDGSHRKNGFTAD